jgi:hypothetical protein
MFSWEFTTDVTLLKEILNLVEPHKREREAIIKCIEKNIVYKCYVAKDCQQNVVAIIIATFLEQSKTLLIEDFALHPKIRNKGFAMKIWDDWRNLVKKEWTDVDALCIEVYLYNVEAWKNIMKVKELFPQPYRLDLAPNSLVMFMGKDLTETAENILIEWRKICHDTNLLFQNKSKI